MSEHCVIFRVVEKTSKFKSSDGRTLRGPLLFKIEPMMLLSTPEETLKDAIDKWKKNRQGQAALPQTGSEEPR